MGEAAATETNELLDAVRGELGKHGEQVATSIEQMRVKVEEVDARVAEMQGAGADEVRAKNFDGLRNGNPLTFDGSKPTEEILEGLRSDATMRYVMVGGVKVPVIETDSQRASLAPWRMIRALMSTVMSGGQRIDFDAAAFNAKRWGDDFTAGHIEQQRDHIRALSGGDESARFDAQRFLGTKELGSGAALVTPEFAAVIIDYLHPRTAVRGSGVTMVPMNSGALNMPFFDQAMSATWVGEGEGAVDSQPREGMLSLVRKILQATVGISNDLMMESSFVVDAIIRMMMTKVLATEEDLALIRSEGSQFTPRGLAYWVEAAADEASESHVFTRTLDAGAPTHLTIRKDALKAQRLVDDANVDFDNTGWIFSNRTVYGLMALASELTGQMIFPELRGGQFMGHPFRKTTQIPNNQDGDGIGVGTGNKTEGYFGSFKSMILAQTESLEIKAFDGGTYRSANGLVSGITDRQTVVTATQKIDFGAGYRGLELAKIDSLDWGAAA